MWINELDIHNIRLADFDDDFNKTRQSASDVILQEGGRSYCYSDASPKNHVWARWGKFGCKARRDLQVDIAGTEYIQSSRFSS